VLPGDGYSYVDAEHSGEYGGGQLCGEVEQGGRAGLSWLESKVAESFVELVGADGSAGLATWEQPWGVGGGCDGGVAVSAGGQLLNESCDGLGEDDGFGSEADAYFLVAGVDSVDGEAAEGGGCLGVKQEKQSGDAVLEVDGVCR
jgi:hypothetical protein